MATPKLTVLALVITLAGAGKKPSTAVSVEELRELLVSSMQTTISLTALVEQQTQEISDITNFMDAARVEIEGLKRKVEALASGDGVQEKIEELGGKVAASVDIFGKEIEALKSREKEVLIVSGEEELRAPSCARVCAGTTLRDSTNWVDFDDNGLYTDVNISKCGFLTVPTVTTSLEGRTSHWTTSGSSEIYDVTTSRFKIYIVAEDARGGKASHWGWNIEWIAVGYTC